MITATELIRHCEWVANHSCDGCKYNKHECINLEVHATIQYQETLEDYLEEYYQEYTIDLCVVKL